MADERKLGDVATRLLMENDRVRIWEMALEPGQASDLHRHDLDYVLVQVAGDKIAGVFDEETEGAYPAGTVEGDVAPGQAMYIEKGGVETAKNTGSKSYHEILIELK
jgi:predicted metal-dependent enzyme (double-stranded beta helix superfamily)